MQATLLTFEIVARFNFLPRSIAVFSSELRRRIGTVPNKLLCAATTSLGASWDWFPWGEATVNSLRNESIQIRECMQRGKLYEIEMSFGCLKMKLAELTF